MLKLPTFFKVTSEVKSSVDSNWESSTLVTERKIICRALVSADVTDQGFAPEDMYAMALSNSFVATFKILAHEVDLSFENLKVLTTLGIDRNGLGAPWLATADFKITLFRPTSSEKAALLLQKTSESCLVLNSINTMKHFQFEIIP